MRVDADDAVRSLLSGEGCPLLGTGLLLTGDAATAEALVEDGVVAALCQGRGQALRGGAVRGAMARRHASGRDHAPAQQIDPVRPPLDPSLAALAAELRGLSPRTRAVAVLRVAEELSPAEVAAALGTSVAEVREHEREAVARLGPAVRGGTGNAGRDLAGLYEALVALAAVPPDPDVTDRVAAAVRARRRRRRVVPAAVAAALLAAVALAAAVPGPPEAPPAGTDAPAAGPVEVLAAPVRGSLAGDAGFLAAARRVPWGTDDDPPLAVREVVYAGDTPTGRVVLVVADTAAGTDGAWLTGPPGTAADRLSPQVPDRLGRTRPATLLVEGPDAATVVVVAAPGDRIEVSPRLRVGPAGAAGRVYAPVPAADGTAVVPVRDAAAGLAAAVRVVRDDRVVHRSGVAPPGPAPAGAGRLDLEPLRPGTAAPDPSLVADAAGRVARPFGIGVAALAPRLLWSAELTRTGGLGSVVVLTGRAPDGGLVVTAHGRLGIVRGGLPVPCATTTAPGDADLARLSAAAVCSVSDGVDEVDRTWLVVTAPPRATTAEVLDDGGGVLDVLTLERGGSMTRTPEGAAVVRLRGADGGTLDVVPVAPAAEEPFGDYGDG